MSASSMAVQGEKTQAKVLKSLGKKPKTAQDVADKLGLSRGAVVLHLKQLVELKQATGEKTGRSVGYKLADASTPRAKSSGYSEVHGSPAA